MSDSIRLFWKKSATKAQHYQMRYKRKEEQENWKFVQTDQDENVVLITGLMSDPGYIFQVRGVYENQQGCFGPENPALKTSKSLGSSLLKYSIKVQKEVLKDINSWQMNKEKPETKTQEQKKSFLVRFAR